MVLNKTKNKRALLRSHKKKNDQLKGFIKTNVLTQQPKKVLLKRQKKTTERQKVKEKTEKVKRKAKKANDEEEQNEYEEAKVNIFSLVDEVKLSPEEEKILSQFRLVESKNNSKKKQMEDPSNKILDSFNTHLKEQETQKYKENILNNPKITLVYSDVATFLKSYTSGKIPQPFHILPRIDQWEKVLEITKPKEWTPQAMFAAIKLFLSLMDPNQAEYFFKKILLPVVRESIKNEKKLNVHYYKCLIKGLHKPQSWLRGILLELCNQEDFTIKEAQIIGSIIHKQSIPVIHASIVIYKLLQLPFTGPIAILVKILINKQYSLPQRVINEFIVYFCRPDEREMPVIWHQNLLRFCELYYNSLDEQQRQQLKKIVSKKTHHIITKEIIKVFNRDQMILEK